MSSPEPLEPSRPSVFLSYASQDRSAAQSLRDTLPGYGLEVWYDESALTGGDAWDQKIRRQIRECDFFMPVISAQTEARPEGYFRREWRLAVERTLDMADDHTFLLPVVIDDTPQAGARVPDRFLTVQWLRLPAGQPTAALEALCRRLVSGEAPAPTGARSPAARPPGAGPARRVREFPEFPREEPGQRIRFWVQVLGWALQSAWTFFRRFPRWIRIALYVWLAIVLASRACVPSGHHDRKISADDARKLAAISNTYRGSSNKADVAKLGAQIAREFADADDQETAMQGALLAVPFSVPAGDAAAARVADAAFAQVYGRLAISHHGKVSLTDEPLKSPEASAAAQRGREQHSRYVLYGAVDESSAAQLTVRIVSAADAAILWTASYPLAHADPAAIAADVDSRLPRLDAD